MNLHYSKANIILLHIHSYISVESTGNCCFTLYLLNSSSNSTCKTNNLPLKRITIYWNTIWSICLVYVPLLLSQHTTPSITLMRVDGGAIITHDGDVMSEFISDNIWRRCWYRFDFSMGIRSGGEIRNTYVEVYLGQRGLGYVISCLPKGVGGGKKQQFVRLASASKSNDYKMISV